MDNKYTIKITTGAMMIAIFSLLLFLNRQTGMMFQEFLIYIFPLPMAVYATLYGWRPGIPVLLGMMLAAFFFGTPITIFYAFTEALIGLVLGGRLYKKADLTTTLVIVMLLSAIVNVLNAVVLASLFGNDLQREILEMQKLMQETYAGMNVEIPETLISASSMLRILIVSMIAFGALQGYIITLLSILVMRRLRIQVPKFRSVYTYYPPKFTGIVAVILFFLYIYTGAKPLGNEVLQSIDQVGGMFGYLYLATFGAIGGMLFLRIYGVRSKIIRILLIFFVSFSFPPVSVLLGVVYICTGYHDRWLEVLESKEGI